VKTNSSRGEAGEEGMRWEKQGIGVTEGTLAGREYLLRDDGRRRDNQQNH